MKVPIESAKQITAIKLARNG